ncbi:MAG: hypothetical protein JSR45_00305 [Proteobacteria bacterium]|nr:hypothetical protein [Pseudomonadota bacterium]
MLIVLLSLALFGGAFFALTAGRPPSAVQTETPLNAGDLPVPDTPPHVIRRELLTFIAGMLFIAAIWIVMPYLPEPVRVPFEIGPWRLNLTWVALLAWAFLPLVVVQEVRRLVALGWRPVRWAQIGLGIARVAMTVALAANLSR